MCAALLYSVLFTYSEQWTRLHSTKRTKSTYKYLYCIIQIFQDSFAKILKNSGISYFWSPLSTAYCSVFRIICRGDFIKPSIITQGFCILISFYSTSEYEPTVYVCLKYGSEIWSHGRGRLQIAFAFSPAFFSKFTFFPALKFVSLAIMVVS